MRLIKNLLGKLIRLLYRLVYRLIPCQNDTVLFISFHGRGYSDNPMALHKYMSTHLKYQKYRCIFAIKNHKEKNIEIENAKIIEYFSIPYFYYLARSKYWIVNCKLPKYVLKKPNQIYLQTWHGTPLKKLAHDIEVPEGTTFYRSEMTVEQMCSTYDNDVSKYNYMISPSAFTTEVFQSAFKIDQARLIETGYPRNDILSNYKEHDLDVIKSKLKIPKDKKVILYAPTWRDNSYVASGYTFELKADFHKWKEILGEEYIVVFKPHYLIINTYEKDSSLQGFLYSIPAEADIRELYVISDMLITDYSSVFFDYAILKRPIYFYMYDIEEYANDLRGFYLDIHKDLPGDIYTNEDELLAAVKQDAYDETAYQAFYERFCSCEDGKAAKRVIDIVFHKE